MLDSTKQLISLDEVRVLVEETKSFVENKEIVSSTEPTNQKEGDYWTFDY